MQSRWDCGARMNSRCSWLRLHLLANPGDDGAVMRRDVVRLVRLAAFLHDGAGSWQTRIAQPFRAGFCVHQNLEVPEGRKSRLPDETSFVPTGLNCAWDDDPSPEGLGYFQDAPPPCAPTIPRAIPNRREVARDRGCRVGWCSSFA